MARDRSFGSWRFQGDFDSRDAAIHAASNLKGHYPDSQFKVLSSSRGGRYRVMYREPKFRRNRGM